MRFSGSEIGIFFFNNVYQYWLRITAIKSMFFGKIPIPTYHQGDICKQNSFFVLFATQSHKYRTQIDFWYFFHKFGCFPIVENSCCKTIYDQIFCIKSCCEKKLFANATVCFQSYGPITFWVQYVCPIILRPTFSWYYGQRTFSWGLPYWSCGFIIYKLFV